VPLLDEQPKLPRAALRTNTNAQVLPLNRMGQPFRGRKTTDPTRIISDPWNQERFAVAAGPASRQRSEAEKSAAFRLPDVIGHCHRFERKPDLTESSHRSSSS
jgi:hypothetical protein